MFPPPRNIPSRASAALRVRAAWAHPAGAAILTGALLGACSAAPVKMECRELQMRIDYGDLTNDQLRFALQELEDCQGRLKAAEAKDSARLEGAERRFTPEEYRTAPDDAAPPAAPDTLPAAAAPAAPAAAPLDTLR